MVVAVLILTVLARRAPAYADPGSDCSQDKNLDLTISACTKSLEGWFVPNDIRLIAHFNRGVAYFRKAVDGGGGKKDCGPAVSDFTAALALVDKSPVPRIMPDSTRLPSLADIYEDRGACYGVLEMYDYAIKDITAALSVYYHDELFSQDSTEKFVSSRKQTVGYYHRGLFYQSLGQREKAIEDYRKAALRDFTFNEPRDALKRLGEPVPSLLSPFGR